MSTSQLSLWDRQRQTLVIAAAVTGVLTGLAVAAFEFITDRVVLTHVMEAPLGLQIVAPVVGLGLAAFSLRTIGRGASPATSDACIAAFHAPERQLLSRRVPGRIIACVATLGFGGAMGFEGPSMFLGGSIGSKIQHQFSRWFRRDDTKALLIAGVAGGVAAIFRAPATGVLFALESPYHEDIARRGLLPALIAAATSYLTFVAIIGTTGVLPIAHQAVSRGVGLHELAGALVLGVLAGLGARGFAAVMAKAKHAGTTWPLAIRLSVSGAGLAGLVLASHAAFGESLSLGPGYHAMAWMVDPARGLWFLAGLFAVRFAATALTVSGGGAGGMFIPLVIQGSILGRFVAGSYDGLGLSSSVSPEAASSFFPILGIAAFLGAGYRTPLAAVMFVAESTGKAEFVVPALIAAAVAQLFMGNGSVSLAQRGRRSDGIDRRLRLPISSVITTDVRTVPSDATVAEFIWIHAIGNRQRTVPVVDNDSYRGTCNLVDASSIRRDGWDDVHVAEIMRVDVPVASPTWNLRDALSAMESADVDQLAVVDDGGIFVGVIAASEIILLHEILSDTGG